MVYSSNTEELEMTNQEEGYSVTTINLPTIRESCDLEGVNRMSHLPSLMSSHLILEKILIATILKSIRQLLYKKCDFSITEYTKTF